MNHIALLAPGLDQIGGAESQLLLLAHGFRARGWRVTVVALSGSASAAADQLAEAGIPVLCLRMRHGLADPRGWLRFHLWLRRERPDVLHAHLPHAAWFARWSRLFAPVRVVTDRLHTTAIGNFRRRFGYVVSSWLTDCVTAVSQPVANAHRHAGIVPPSRLLVLPNGVDVEACAPDPAVRQSLRDSLGLRGSDFLWLAAGRLAPVKDYPTLLKALALLPVSAHLIVAGEGPLLGELRALAARLGLQSRVRFLGFQPRVLHWMKAADALVLSSLWEGLPSVLLEAAASALPAVATNIPGARPLSALLAGPLPPPSNPAALAAAMGAVMLAPTEERARNANLARRQVAAQFNLDTALDRWESLYDRFLEIAPEPRRWAHPGTSFLAAHAGAELKIHG